MRRFSLQAYFFIFLVLISCVKVFAAEKKIVTTCTDYTPYFAEGGKRVFNGRNIETLFHVVESLEYKLDTSIRAPFVRCVKLLEQGKIDVIAGLIYTQERAEKFKLIPYRERAPLAIFYLKTKHPDFSLKSLGKNDVIGMHRAFALPDEIKNSELQSHLTSITSVSVGMDMLLKGRLNGVLATVNTGELILEDWPEAKNQIVYQLLPVQSDDSVYFAIHPESILAQRKEDIVQILRHMAQAPEFKHLN